jgi:predicted nucleotidyltransferase
MNENQNDYINLFSEMIKKIKEKLNIHSVILFGSRGRGTSNKYSDYDILIIADFKEDYFERLYWVSNYTPQVPIDLFCYTPNEFETMFAEYRLTAMDAMEDGIILFGEDYLKSYKQRYNEFKKHGMKREKCVLIPSVLQN